MGLPFLLINGALECRELIWRFLVCAQRQHERQPARPVLWLPLEGGRAVVIGTELLGCVSLLFLWLCQGPWVWMPSLFICPCRDIHAERGRLCKGKRWPWDCSKMSVWLAHCHQGAMTERMRWQDSGSPVREEMKAGVGFRVHSTRTTCWTNLGGWHYQIGQFCHKCSVPLHEALRKLRTWERATLRNWNMPAWSERIASTSFSCFPKYSSTYFV